MVDESLLLAKLALTSSFREAGWGGYLWQLGLEARLLGQGVVDGLQEAPFHHIKGLEARGGQTGTGVRAKASAKHRCHLMLKHPLVIAINRITCRSSCDGTAGTREAKVKSAEVKSTGLEPGHPGMNSSSATCQLAVSVSSSMNRDKCCSEDDGALSTWLRVSRD